MDTTRICQRCRQPVSSIAPAGLCPNCLLASGLDLDAPPLDDAVDHGDPQPQQPVLPLDDPSVTTSPDLTSAANAPPSPGGEGRGEGEPSSNAPRAPQIRYFGDYVLQEEIARGGMGVVYKARQVSLNRIVAVKMILSGQLAGAAEVQRFRHEAESAASLQHPNIVAIHEIGEHEGHQYFSMDYVEGKDLADLVRAGPLPAKRAAAYVKTIAVAIDYAHRKGVLHRDLKPSNILIDQNDQPRVTDFGLAKRLPERGQLVRELGSSNQEASKAVTRGQAVRAPDSLTLSGQILGTPNYMPPEQARGRRSELGPSSDVYALGGILFFLLTGRPPFVGETLEGTLLQVLHLVPGPPSRLVPGIPRDLETICLKCLEKEPARRYATAQDLSEELARFQRDELILARTVSAPEKLWRWCRRKPGLAGLVTAMAVVALAAFIGGPKVLRRLDRHVEARNDLQRARAQGQARADFLRENNIPARDPRCPPETTDLTDHYNAGLTKRWHAHSVDNTLSELPRGLQKLAGVPFDVRGLIQLGSESGQSRNFPDAVRQIQVGRPARRFYFLHAVSEPSRKKTDERVGSYIIHFANEQTRVIPLVYGRDLRDWWTAKGEPLEATAAVIAWRGSNPSTKRRGSELRLFMSAWESPLPGTKVESIDFASSMSGPAPFLIAITVE